MKGKFFVLLMVTLALIAASCAPAAAPQPVAQPTEAPAQAPAPQPTQPPAPEPTQAPAAEPTQPPAPEPTQAPAAEPATTAAVEPTAAPAAASTNPTLTQDPGSPTQERYWVKYNFATGAYEIDKTAQGDPRSWQPSFGQAPAGTVICFTAESEEFDWDTKLVNPSMRSNADKVGAKLLLYNNAYPSTSQPLANADACITAGAKAVVSFNVMSEVSPALMKKYDAAKIPVIAVDVFHPGSVFFGADNCRTGELAAEYAMKWAKDHNWPEKEMTVLVGSDPAVGGAPVCRNTAFVDAIKKAMPGIPAANYFDLDMRTAAEGVTAGALSATTDWLTAHPDAKYIMATTINDDRAVGIANAMVQAGRGDPTKDGIVIGKNADAAGLAAVRRPNTPFVGTVAFFGQRYGEYLVNLAVDVLQGKPVPSIVSVPHEVITKDNIDKWYPETKQ